MCMFQLLPCQKVKNDAKVKCSCKWYLIRVLHALNTHDFMVRSVPFENAVMMRVPAFKLQQTHAIRVIVV